MMIKLISLILFFVPHPINVQLRRLLGQRIGQGSKIHLFSMILSTELEIGCNVYIAPFTIVKANKIQLGDYSHIAPFSIISAPLIKGAEFHLGRHSRVFPFCWIEPGEGVYIGDHVGIGGHTLIFTHGSWSDYLHGGPVSFGAVHIKDHVWLPWRVFIMPGVTIGERAIIAANSTVTQSVPDHTLVAGSPAKVVKENINQELDREAFAKRVSIIISEFNKYQERVGQEENKIDENSVYFYRSHLGENFSDKAMLNIDLTIHKYICNSENDLAKMFIVFLRRYGIRLEPV